MVEWTAPPIWKGGECWIIGGGPSIPKQFGVPDTVIKSVTTGGSPSQYSPYLSAIHKKHLIGINNAYKLGDWIDVHFFGDSGWFLNHRHMLINLTCLKVTCCTRFGHRSKEESEGIRYLSRDPNKPFGINDNPSKVCWNNNSGAAAISLAAHFGVKRIVLLGFDMSMDGIYVSHWFGSHNLGNKRPKAPPFTRHLKGFSAIAEDAKRMGIEIINASPTSAITQFPKVSVKDLL